MRAATINYDCTKRIKSHRGDSTTGMWSPTPDRDRSVGTKVRVKLFGNDIKRLHVCFICFICPKIEKKYLISSYDTEEK